MIEKIDKASRLRSLLEPGLKWREELQYPENADDSQQAELKRKVLSLGRNILRIVDSGNSINKVAISNKIGAYLDLVDSELREDPAQQYYVNLLHEIKGLLLSGGLECSLCTS